MPRTALDEAFAHHAWATIRLTDACLTLSPAQLETTVPGTYGSIIGTLRHLVGADSWYLFRLGAHDAPTPAAEEETMSVADLRAAAERWAVMWPAVLAADPDPDEVVSVAQDDGSTTGATKGMRLAQVLHHGTDHRSQVCTALTSLGIEPPEIDVWAYGTHAGLVTETPAPGE